MLTRDQATHQNKQHGKNFRITLSQNVSCFCRVTNGEDGWKIESFTPTKTLPLYEESDTFLGTAITRRNLFMLTTTCLPHSAAATEKFGSPTLILCFSSMLRNAVLTEHAGIFPLISKNCCSIMLIGMLLSKLPLLNHKLDL